MIDWNNNGRIDPEEIILTQFLLSEEDEEEEEDEFGEERERTSINSTPAIVYICAAILRNID